MSESNEHPAGEVRAFVLEWLTAAVPPGVTTGWEGGTPDDDADLDDPDREPVPVVDEAWDRARRVLFEDAAVAEARQAVGERFGTPYDRVTVWLALRDGVDEPDVTLWAPDPDDAGPDETGAADETGAPDDTDHRVVLIGVTDASDLRELDPSERTDVYLELVTGLLQVALEEA